MTISKNSVALDLDYETMRLDALALVQKLSGNVWTDYNIHDPGVTLLEEVIFALTELGYKTEFEIEDFLTSKEDVINLQREALYTPKQVKECIPVTAADYSDFFSKRLDGVKRVEFLNGDNGMYAVQIIPEKESAEFKKNVEKQILESFKNLWREWRILGESVSSVHFDWTSDVAKQTMDEMTEELASNTEINRKHRDILNFTPIIEQFPSVYRIGSNAELLQKFLNPVEFLFKRFLDAMAGFSDLFSLDALKTNFENYNKILDQMLAIYGVEFPSELFNKIHKAKESANANLLRSKAFYVRHLPKLHMHRCGKYFSKRLEIMLGIKTIVVDGIFVENGAGKVKIVWGRADYFSEEVQSEMEHFVREELPAHLIPEFYWLPGLLPNDVTPSFFNQNERFKSESLWI